MKKLMAIGLAVATAFGLVGCGGSQSTASSAESSSVESTSESQEESSTESPDSSALAKDEIKIDELPWEITTMINDYGNREFVVAYTNNSKYAIMGFDIEFTLKDGLTDDQMAVFEDLKEEYEYTDEELSELTMKVYNEVYTAAGEEGKPQPLTLDNYAFRVPSSMDQIDNFEPDIATIGYITPDNVMHMEFYDFKNDSYTLSSTTKDNLYQLPTTAIKDILPAPEVPVLISDKDLGGAYSATAYGIKQDGYSEYVATCKDSGFTDVTEDTDYSFEASKSDGARIELRYYSEDESMTIKAYPG